MARPKAVTSLDRLGFETSPSAPFDAYSENVVKAQASKAFRDLSKGGFALAKARAAEKNVTDDELFEAFSNFYSGWTQSIIQH